MDKQKIICRYWVTAKIRIINSPDLCQNTLAARGLEGTCANYPDFFENHQFHVIYLLNGTVVLYVYYYSQYGCECV
jgi:hypothetical protein